MALISDTGMRLSEAAGLSKEDVHLNEDIPIKGEVGQIRPTSFDGRDWNDLTCKEQVYGAPEYSLWNRRNIY